MKSPAILLHPAGAMLLERPEKEDVDSC